ncbi:hypothetical protein BJ742DRAFT_850082 [Cladochytrium replicatum]|nr:hypothetical protein BJ742DRAFT_850082 [Cladochytrium replicatum]
MDRAVEQFASDVLLSGHISERLPNSSVPAEDAIPSSSNVEEPIGPVAAGQLSEHTSIATAEVHGMIEEKLKSPARRGRRTKGSQIATVKDESEAPPGRPRRQGKVPLNDNASGNPAEGVENVAEPRKKRKVTKSVKRPSVEPTVHQTGSLASGSRQPDSSQKIHPFFLRNFRPKELPDGIKQEYKPELNNTENGATYRENSGQTEELKIEQSICQTQPPADNAHSIGTPTMVDSEHKADRPNIETPDIGECNETNQGGCNHSSSSPQQSDPLGFLHLHDMFLNPEQRAMKKIMIEEQIRIERQQKEIEEHRMKLQQKRETMLQVSKEMSAGRPLNPFFTRTIDSDQQQQKNLWDSVRLLEREARWPNAIDIHVGRATDGTIGLQTMQTSCRLSRSPVPRSLPSTIVKPRNSLTSVAEAMNFSDSVECSECCGKCGEESIEDYLVKLYGSELLSLPSCTPLFRNLVRGIPAEDSGSWIDKYHPRGADQVLGQRNRAFVSQQMRNWLSEWKRAARATMTAHSDIAGKRKRKFGSKGPKGAKNLKRRNQLRDFIVNDGESEQEVRFDLFDDEDDEDYFEARSKPSKERSKSKEKLLSCPPLLVICGPSGSGKTASVYAVAGECGFEVLEVNPGQRRGGKELQAACLEATQSHVLGRAKDSPHPTAVESKPLKAFFKSLGTSDLASSNEGAVDNLASIDDTLDQKSRGRSRRVLRQSDEDSSDIDHKLADEENVNISANTLQEYGENGQTLSVNDNAAKSNLRDAVVLIEEADILFEHDRGFWGGLASIIQKSKRPLVITCEDDPLRSNNPSMPPNVLPALRSSSKIVRSTLPSIQELRCYVHLILLTEGYWVCDLDELALICESRVGDVRSILLEMELKLRFRGLSPSRDTFKVTLASSLLNETGTEKGDARLTRELQVIRLHRPMPNQLSVAQLVQTLSDDGGLLDYRCREVLIAPQTIHQESITSLVVDGDARFGEIPRGTSLALRSDRDGGGSKDRLVGAVCQAVKQLVEVDKIGDSTSPDISQSSEESEASHSGQPEHTHNQRSLVDMAQLLDNASYFDAMFGDWEWTSIQASLPDSVLNPENEIDDDGLNKGSDDQSSVPTVRSESVKEGIKDTFSLSDVCIGPHSGTTTVRYKVHDGHLITTIGFSITREIQNWCAVGIFWHVLKPHCFDRSRSSSTEIMSLQNQRSREYSVFDNIQYFVSNRGLANSPRDVVLDYLPFVSFACSVDNEQHATQVRKEIENKSLMTQPNQCGHVTVDSVAHNRDPIEETFSESNAVESKSKCVVDSTNMEQMASVRLPKADDTAEIASTTSPQELMAALKATETIIVGTFPRNSLDRDIHPSTSNVFASDQMQSKQPLHFETIGDHRMDYLACGESDDPTQNPLTSNGTCQTSDGSTVLSSDPATNASLMNPDMLEIRLFGDHDSMVQKEVEGEERVVKNPTGDLTLVEHAKVFLVKQQPQRKRRWRFKRHFDRIPQEIADTVAGLSFIRDLTSQRQTD